LAAGNVLASYLWTVQVVKRWCWSWNWAIIIRWSTETTKWQNSSIIKCYKWDV